MKLTPRQMEALDFLNRTNPNPTPTGSDGSVFRTLETKGLVRRGQVSYPGYIAYYWHITDQGKKALALAHEREFVKAFSENKYGELA